MIESLGVLTVSKFSTIQYSTDVVRTVSKYMYSTYSTKFRNGFKT